MQRRNANSYCILIDYFHICKQLTVWFPKLTLKSSLLNITSVSLQIFTSSLSKNSPAWSHLRQVPSKSHVLGGPSSSIHQIMKGYLAKNKDAPTQKFAGHALSLTHLQSGSLCSARLTTTKPKKICHHWQNANFTSSLSLVLDNHWTDRRASTSTQNSSQCPNHSQLPLIRQKIWCQLFNVLCQIFSKNLF